MNAISDSCGAAAPQPSLVAQIGAPDDARNFGDVLVWSAGTGNENHYLFLPLQLSLTQNLNDLPNVGMFDAGGMGFFYATVSWQLTPERLELLRRDLTPEDGTPPHLSYAPVTVTAAQVITCDHDGVETVIHEQKPSPHPPFTAMLQFSTDADARTTIMSALQGNPGRLLLRYAITRQVELERTYRITGLFPEDTSPAGIAAALERGDLTLTPDPETDALRAKVLEQAGISQILHSANASAGLLEITLSDPTVHAFTITADVGRAMSAHRPINDPLPPT